MKQLFKNIHNRITFWLLFLALIPLIFGLSLAFNYSVEQVEEQTFNKLEAIRNLKVNQLNSWFEEREGDLYSLQADVDDDFDFEHIKKNLETSAITRDDLSNLNSERNHLNNFLSNYKSYSEIFIIDAITHRVLVSTNKVMEGRIFHLFDKNKQLKEYTIRDVYLSKRTSKVAMDFSIPIFNKKANNPQAIGIIVANIDLENSLYNLLSNKSGLGETGETLVVNSDLIAINRLRWHDDDPLTLKLTAKPTVNAANGETGILKTVDYRGEKILAAYTFIPKMKWGFVSKQDMQELNKPIRRVMTNFILIFIVVALIIILFSFSISKSISNPITELNKIALNIKKGDYSIKNAVTGKDEIGSLSLTINEMAAAIQSKNIIQKGISSISDQIIKQPSLETFSTILIKQITKLTDASWSAFYILNELTSKFEPYSSVNIKVDFLLPVSNYESKNKFGEKLNKNKVFKTRQLDNLPLNNPENTNKEEMVIIPIQVDNVVIAFIAMVNKQKFSKESFTILTKSQANISSYYSNLISNLRVKVLTDNVMQTNIELDEKKDTLISQNKDLIDQKKITEDANKELEAFSYSVSHDLRAPLRHIDGFTKLLYNSNKNPLDKKSKSYYDNIVSSTSQMNQLIEDLLVFSRMGRKKLTKTPVNMKTIVHEALQVFTLHIAKNNVSVVVDDMPNALLDSTLITQVWINLIENAIKFSSKTKKPKIHIGVIEVKNQNPVYYIKDNGVGFDEKYIDKLFGVFQRLHTNVEFSGTGIGLANVKRIIQKHKGAIWAEGKINKGASFFFTVPD